MAKVAINGGGARPHERRGGRRKGTPNKAAADRLAEIANLSREHLFNL